MDGSGLVCFTLGPDCVVVVVFLDGGRASEVEVEIVEGRELADGGLKGWLLVVEVTDDGW